MSGWLEVVILALLIIVLLQVPLGVLAGRRRWLARQGRTFECSVRLYPADAGSGWALGVARYNDSRLEWFRFFSYSIGPRLVFPRPELRVIETREPEPSEAVALYAGQQVVRVEKRGPHGGQVWDLAMSRDSLTGLLSWLEAAPPGVTASY